MAKRSRARSGFTLVELLVVILIIGLLMAILFPAVRMALRRGNNFRMATDLSNLNTAVNAYKLDYKDFPPDFTDAAVKPFDQTVAYRHIRKAFPRIDAGEMTLIAAYVKNPGINAAEALVFWLGGLSKNPRQPFTGKGGPLYATGNANRPLGWRIQERIQPFMSFEESRLNLRLDPNGETDANGNVIVVGACYLPSGGNTTPYVYFDSRTYGFIYTDASNNQVPGYASLSWNAPDGSGVTVALPYKSDIANTGFKPVTGSKDSILRDRELHFANRDTFQIVCAGIDGEFGPRAVLAYNDPNSNMVPFFTRFPSGGWYHPSYNAQNPPPSSADVYRVGQDDNLANFSEGKTLGDSR